ncbi:MAG TPA: DUF6265 family protein [Chitinophagaceae bacterium]|nr:DUF6265 family protein [Chitinophagaceae bacterium]
MKKILTPFLLFLLFAAFISKPADNMKPFTWLRGTWTMKMKKGIITEYWYTKNDSTLQGESKMVSLTGQSNPLENLRIMYESGNYFYISKVIGQNNGQEVKFRITSYDGDEFIAENPEHDFPKRITYQLVNRDSLHAFIDGGPSMTDKRSDFYYSRVKD